MAELGVGCYLTFDTSSAGILYVTWSQTPVEGALAYFSIGADKKVPGFKFKQKGGKSELTRNCGQLEMQRFYGGWCSFVKEALKYNGQLVIIPNTSSDIKNPAVYLSDSNNGINKVEENVATSLSNMKAVAAVSTSALCFNAQTMATSLFISTGHEHGESLQLVL